LSQILTAWWKADASASNSSASLSVISPARSNARSWQHEAPGDNLFDGSPLVSGLLKEVGHLRQSRRLDLLDLVVGLDSLGLELVGFPLAQFLLAQPDEHGGVAVLRGLPLHPLDGKPAAMATGLEDLSQLLVVLQAAI
jgi:hypothetical protein